MAFLENMNFTTAVHCVLTIFFLCFLQAECARLKHTLATAKGEHEAKMAEFVREEKEIKEENLRLQRRLQLEMERREALCR